MKKEVQTRRPLSCRRVISVLTVILLLCSTLMACSKKASDEDPPDQSAAVTSEAKPTATAAPTGPPKMASGETNMQAVIKLSTAVVYLTINPELALYVDENNISNATPVTVVSSRARPSFPFLIS